MLTSWKPLTKKRRIRIWLHNTVVRIRGSGSVPKCHGSTTLFQRFSYFIFPHWPSRTVLRPTGSHHLLLFIIIFIYLEHGLQPLLYLGMRLVQQSLVFCRRKKVKKHDKLEPCSLKFDWDNDPLPEFRPQHPPTHWNWGAADEAVLNNVHKKRKSKKIPLKGIYGPAPLRIWVTHEFQDFFSVIFFNFPVSKSLLATSRRKYWPQLFTQASNRVSAYT